MANVEKTIKGLLSKFNARESYETRKIVFWYDTDKTAKEEDIKEIQSELEKQDIKIVILKNNFFEIKKIIEHDNPESNFLVYSQENEKKYEENWLLDVQLYSTRFENSRVADVKSIFNIDGSKLDKFIEVYRKKLKVYDDIIQEQINTEITKNTKKIRTKTSIPISHFI